MNHVRAINKEYLDEFAFRVTGNLSSLIRATDTQFLKVIMNEVNRLFQIMSNRMTLKRDVFLKTDFPDSASYNKFLENIDIDLTKLYNAENVIINDLQNLVNFNSLERERMINELSLTQKIVYKAYLKSKKNMSGNIVIREDFDTDTLPEGSSNVQINLDSEMLTLRVLTSELDRESVDYDFTDITFESEPPARYNIFPNSPSLYVGSFWKKSSNDPHFKYKMPKSQYKSLMSDTPTEDGMGACEFEKVFTPAQLSIRDDLEYELSQILQLSPHLIMLDRLNSSHGKFLYPLLNDDKNQVLINNNVILTIPYTNNASVSTSAIVNFQANDSNLLPTVDYSNSYVYDTTGRKIALLGISEEKQDKYQKTGHYYFAFDEPIRPGRIELSLRYAQQGWSIMQQYMMSHWVYEKHKSISVDTNMDSSVSIQFKRTAHICVDTELDELSERNRVVNVMNLKGVDK